VQNSLTLYKPCLLWFVSSLFSCLMNGTCLPVLRSKCEVVKGLTLYKPCMLWLVSSLFSCFMSGTCLPCLAVKMLSGEGS